MLSVALLFFDTPEMDLYAVQFLSQVAFMGIPLVSNWFVLIVSASVFLLSLGHAGWKSDRPARM
jgi:hypothetical protein